MTVCLLRIGDGRNDVHERSWASLREALPHWDFDVIVNDSDHELGFAGAIQRAWEQVPPDAEWVFHAELDFIYHQPIPLDRMIAVLEKHPYLAQMALKRQPVNETECVAGGIVEAQPENFTQRFFAGDVWTESRVCFTTNPSVYSAHLCRHGWPQVPESEGVFTHQLLEDSEVRFGFWGPKFAPPPVEHIGERIGRGY